MCVVLSSCLFLIISSLTVPLSLFVGLIVLVAVIVAVWFAALNASSQVDSQL